VRQGDSVYSSAEVRAGALVAAREAVGLSIAGGGAGTSPVDARREHQMEAQDLLRAQQEARREDERVCHALAALPTGGPWRRPAPMLLDPSWGVAFGEASVVGPAEAQREAQVPRSAAVWGPFATHNSPGGGGGGGAAAAAADDPNNASGGSAPVDWRGLQQVPDTPIIHDPYADPYAHPAVSIPFPVEGAQQQQMQQMMMQHQQQPLLLAPAAAATQQQQQQYHHAAAAVLPPPYGGPPAQPLHQQQQQQQQLPPPSAYGYAAQQPYHQQHQQQQQQQHAYQPPPPHQHQHQAYHQQQQQQAPYGSAAPPPAGPGPAGAGLQQALGALLASGILGAGAPPPQQPPPPQPYHHQQQQQQQQHYPQQHRQPPYQPQPQLQPPIGAGGAAQRADLPAYMLRRQVCKWYRAAQGCRRGDTCGYLHAPAGSSDDVRGPLGP
jgi:hypothetical protein